MSIRRTSGFGSGLRFGSARATRAATHAPSSIRLANMLFLPVRRPPSPTLFPYTTLFRSRTRAVRPSAPDRTRISPLGRGRVGQSGGRSEEHTSELQSLTNLVCRLLLEKKTGLEDHDRADRDEHPPHVRLRQRLAVRIGPCDPRRNPRAFIDQASEHAIFARPAATVTYTLSLHDALPISNSGGSSVGA